MDNINKFWYMLFGMYFLWLITFVCLLVTLILVSPTLYFICGTLMLIDYFYYKRLMKLVYVCGNECGEYLYRNLNKKHYD